MNERGVLLAKEFTHVTRSENYIPWNDKNKFAHETRIL